MAEHLCPVFSDTLCYNAISFKHLVLVSHSFYSMYGSYNWLQVGMKSLAYAIDMSECYWQFRKCRIGVQNIMLFVL